MADPRQVFDDIQQTHNDDSPPPASDPPIDISGYLFRTQESASSRPDRSISASSTILGNSVPDVFGEVEVTGYLGAINYASGSLTVGVVFALGEQDSISSIKINGDLATGLSWVTVAPTGAQVHVGDGSTTLSTYLTSISGWSADDTTLWKSLAHCVILISTEDASVPGSLTVTATLGGKKFSDFRTSTTDVHTNPIDIAYYLRTDGNWLENAATRIDSTSWERVADWCDEVMADSSLRYTFIGRVDRRDPDGALSDVLGSVLASEYVGPDGKIRLWCEMLPPLIPGDWTASASQTLTGSTLSSIVSDDFASAASGNWTEETPSTADDEWLYSSDRLLYRHKDTAATGSSHSVWSNDDAPSEDDFSAVLRCRFLTYYSGKSFDYWGHACVFFRGSTYSGSYFNGYAAGIKFNYDNSGGGGGTTGEYAQIKLFKLEGSSLRTEIASFTTSFNTYTDDGTWANSETLNLRVHVTGDLIQLRAWEHGTTEPSSWDLQVIDTTFQSAGYLGIYGYANAYNGDGWGWADFEDLAFYDYGSITDASGVSVGDGVLFEDNTAATVTGVDSASTPQTITVDKTVTISAETLRLISGIHLSGPDWVSVPEAADIDLGTIPDVVQVRYSTAALGDERVYPDDVSAYNKRTEITVAGCTTTSQAKRVSETRKQVRSLQRINWSGVASAVAYGLEPGDVFRISDDVLDEQLVMVLPPVKHKRTGHIELAMRLFDQDAYSSGTATTRVITIPDTGWDGGAKAPSIPSVVEITSDYTATNAPLIVLCDCSSNDITVTLPTAKDLVGLAVTVKKIDSSSYTVTVEGDTVAETIDDQTTVTITNQYDSISPVSDDSDWWIV